MRICLFDPGIGNNDGSPSANLGDLIIQEAVNREILDLFQKCELSSISTHVFPTEEQIEIARNSDLALVGGTNLLGSKMRDYIQWRVSLKQKMKLRKCVLLGVGWRNYESNPDLYTRISLQAVLSSKYLHSVRDSYTKTKLNNAGFNNVLNTGCPTMWPFVRFKPEDISKEKSEYALLMLTDYSTNAKADRKLIDLALSNYKKVFVWSQGKNDMTYITSLMSDVDFSLPVVGQGAFHRILSPSDFADSPLLILDHSISVFKLLLNSTINFDYIGTRLHGGVKCLLSGRRSLILEVDNRAKEIACDTGLPTTDRENFDYIRQWINGGFTTNIKINPEPINQWKAQFKQFS